MGMTFMSGAEEAWVIDNLNKEGRNDLHQEYFIKGSSFSALGAIFAPMIGAILVKSYSIKILWFIFGFGFFLNAALVTILAKEHFKPKKIKPLQVLKMSYSHSKMGLILSIRHKVIYFSIIAGVFTQLMFCGGIGIQQFLLSLGMEENQLGYLYSIAAGVGTITVFLSRFLVKFKPKNLMSVIVLVIMLLLLSLSFVPPTFFILACIVFIMKDGILKLGIPIYQTYLHSFIPGKIRASTLSVNNMISKLVITVSALVAGAFLDVFGPQKVLSLAGLFGIGAIFFYQKIKD